MIDKVEMIRLYGVDFGVRFILSNERAGLWISLEKVIMVRNGRKNQPDFLYGIESKEGHIFVLADDKMIGINPDFLPIAYNPKLDKLSNSYKLKPEYKR